MSIIEDNNIKVIVRAGIRYANLDQLEPVLAVLERKVSRTESPSKINKLEEAISTCNELLGNKNITIAELTEERGRYLIKYKLTLLTLSALLIYDITKLLISTGYL